MGARFLSVVEHKVRQIERDRQTGYPSEFETRTLLVGRFPYKIVFREFGHRLVILAVAHQSRAPEYWHGRVEDIND